MSDPVCTRMKAVLLTAHGGLDVLSYREDIAVPEPGPDDVLIRVGACGVNNTDINTRTAWYHPDVTTGNTEESVVGGFPQVTADTATWGGQSVTLPRIQGADIAGKVVSVGENVPEARVGERVLVDPWLRAPGHPEDLDGVRFVGSEVDGGFTQYVTIPSSNALVVHSTLSDAELATFPCSYVTAENMLDRIALAAEETILVTGASGGVGSALVQLAQRRSARVIAMASKHKEESLRELGAEFFLDRDERELPTAVSNLTGRSTVDVVADVVGGDVFPELLSTLRRGGRYVCSGAIAGPIVPLDLRPFYLRDLALYGATVTALHVFPGLIRYIEAGEIQPLLAKTYPLSEIRDAQTDFMQKKHVGKLVLIPPKN